MTEPVAQRQYMVSGTLAVPSAHQHCNGSFEVGRAADQKGTMSYRIQGESIYMSVCLSVCPSVHPSVCSSVRLYTCPSLIQPCCRALDGETDGRTYVQIPLVFYRISSPLSPLHGLLQNCHCNVGGQGYRWPYIASWRLVEDVGTHVKVWPEMIPFVKPFGIFQVLEVPSANESLLADAAITGSEQVFVGSVPFHRSNGLPISQS